MFLLRRVFASASRCNALKEFNPASRLRENHSFRAQDRPNGALRVRNLLPAPPDHRMLPS